MLDDDVAALAHEARQAGALGAEHEADALARRGRRCRTACARRRRRARRPRSRRRAAAASVAGRPGDEGDRHVLDGAGRRLGDGRRDVHGPVARHAARRATPAPSQLRMIAPRLPGSVTPSMATRNGGRPGRRLIRSASSASGSAAAKAITPCGASLRARASSLPRATWATGTRLAAARATMSATPSSGVPSWADELGREPDLVDPAAPGDQQLADGLAALDLLAAEALGALGRVRVGRRRRAGRRRCGRRRGCAAPGPWRAGCGRGVERAPVFPAWPRRRDVRRPASPDGPTGRAGAGRPARRRRPPRRARAAAARRAAGRAHDVPGRARRRRSRRCPRRGRARRGPRAAGP